MEYNHHFLTNVIFRIDFVSEIEELKTNLNPAVRECCIKAFPIAESTEMITKEIKVNAKPEKEETIVNSKKAMEWDFWGKNREKKLVITSKSIFVDHNQYSTFEEFKMEFFDVFSTLLSVYPNIKINRIGLRYIDQIKISDTKAINNWKTFWNKYIASSLVGGLDFPDTSTSMSRYMSSLEMNYGEYMLRFQYGMFNSDYPAPNKRKDFVLDTDVYSVGLFSIMETEELMKLFHGKAKEWFEKAIKEPLRVKMGAIKDEN